MTTDALQSVNQIGAPMQHTYIYKIAYYNLVMEFIPSGWNRGCHDTLQHKQQNSKVSGAVVIFLVSTYVLIIYTTTMNILCSFSVYSCVQSENKHKTKQYSACKLAVVGAYPTFYIHINYSYK